MKYKKSSIILIFLTLVLSACSKPSVLGEWQTEMTYTASDNTTSMERLTLRFDKDGKVYKNGQFYGQYDRKGRKRVKFFSKNRKLVFYGSFTNRHTIEGRGLHIPNDQLFAKWTAKRNAEP